MNQPLDIQLEQIEQRVIKLVDQIAHYRRLCSDLLDSKRKLEAENKLLRETMQEQNAFIAELETQLKAQPQTTAVSAIPTTNAELVKQVEQHIAQLDATIQWLSNE